MVSLLRHMLAVLGCAVGAGVQGHGLRPPPMSSQPAIAVRGPTEHCRATYVFLGPVYEQAENPDVFKQYPGTLDGADFGACTLLGPSLRGEWLWVMMSFETGFRGELSCWVGTQRSPTLEVVGSDQPLPDHIRGRYLFMDQGAVDGRIVPTGSQPCPDLSPEDAGPQGPAFQ